MPSVGMKVGALARRTGVSVRTLHHYDEIGLLTPSGRTASGHRLYGAGDIARLQQIRSLRQLGFSLDQVLAFLTDPDCSPRRVIELHLSALKEQVDLQQRLCRRLEALAGHLQAAEDVSVDALIQTIEAITMYEKYYTPEQLKALEERAQGLGEEGMRRAQQDWEDIYAQARVEMEKGTDPTSEPVLSLARRALALIQAFTGGDAGIERSLNTLYEQEGPEVASRGMFDAALGSYLGKAMEVVRQDL